MTSFRDKYFLSNFLCMIFFGIQRARYFKIKYFQQLCIFFGSGICLARCGNNIYISITILLDMQTLLLMCNLDSSLTDLMNETLGLGLQNRLPRFLGIIFFGRSQSCKQISSPINGKKNWVGTSTNFSGNGYYLQVVRITKSQNFFS